MTITERMITIKNKLIEADREAAIEALTEYIYHAIGPRVAGAGRYVLFDNDDYTGSFRSKAHIDEAALTWLFGKMESEGLLEISDSVISLTALGVKNLCKP